MLQRALVRHLGTIGMLMKKIRGVLICLLSLFLATAPLTNAQAQTANAPIPPIKSSIDRNGVDLQTGFAVAEEHYLSIGDLAHGGLEHSRQWLSQIEDGSGPTDGDGTNGGWRHNYMMTATYDSGHNTITIMLGSVNSMLFTGGTGNWKPADQSPWTLSQAGTILTLTGPDGSSYTFDSQPNGMDIGSYYGTATSVGTQITRPNGETIKLSYKTSSYRVYFCNLPCSSYSDYNVTRLTSVQTSTGYQLHYSYGSDDVNNVGNWTHIGKVQAINLSQNYCDPSSDQCTGNFPMVTYYDGNNPQNTLQQINVVTRPGGGTTTYITWSYYLTGGGNIILSVQDSVNPSANISFNHDGPGGQTVYRVNTVTKNGVLYKYNYTSWNNNMIVKVNDSANNMLWHAETDKSYGTLMLLQDNRYYEQFSWDSYGRMAGFNSGTSYGYGFGYDNRGNRTGVSYTDGNYYYSSNASYDATCSNPKTCNQPNTTTDYLGNITAYTYDPVHGGVTSVTSPAATTGGIQPQVRTAYTQLFAYFKNASGSMVASTTGVYLPTSTSACVTTASCAGTADEVKTTTMYGATGVANNLLPTATTTAAGNGAVSATTTFAYDPVGNKISEDGPLAGTADTTKWAYNADRQVTQVISSDPDGSGPLHNRTVNTSYNANGQVTSVSTGYSASDGTSYVELSRADTTYDSYARKVKDTVTAGGTIQARTDYNYDTLDRSSCTAVRMNPAVFTTSTADACTLGMQGSYGPDRIQRNMYWYDGYDVVYKVQDAVALPYQRDSTSKMYYQGHLLASVTDANNNITSYSYDGIGRLFQTNYPSSTTPGTSSSTDYEAVTYDANSNVLTRRLRDGKQISYTYDNLGRQTLAHMVNPVDANDRDIATTYDLLGRATSIDDGAGRKVSYTYDQLGRVLTESPQLTGGSVTHQYDAAGRLTRLTYPDTFYVTYDYDTLGEITAVRENGATSGVPVVAKFTYDERGKATALVRGNGVNDTYGYDPLGRLATLAISHPTASNTYTYGYNPAGQMISRTMTNDSYAWTQPAVTNRAYTVNGLNQYTASGAIVPTYDGRGNMTSAGATTYTYDSKDHLTTFGANTLYYDAVGRLVRQASPDTRFIYDGSDLIEEANSSNTITTRYIRIPGTDNVLVWYPDTGGTNRRWLAHDERGSTTLITDPWKNLVVTNAYDEYGIPASTNQGRFQYTGQSWLPPLGMYYYKARIYSATMGRFMQTDPKGYDDGANWYNYTHGDPINGTDPTGTAVFITSGTINSSTCNNEIDNEARDMCYSNQAAQQTVNIFGSPSAPYSGPVSNPNSAFKGIDFGGGASPGGGGLASSSPRKKPIKLSPGTKAYLCGKLKSHSFDVPSTYSEIYAFRYDDNHPSNQLVAAPREAENWIWATGNYSRVPHDGETHLSVWAYQIWKKTGWSPTPYSSEAEDAGYNGVDHSGETQATLSGELQSYCGGRQ